MNTQPLRMREINGDDRLSIVDRIRYLWVNFHRNLFVPVSTLKPIFYTPDRVDLNLLTASPLRAYVETFFAKKLPSLISPGPIRVLDIGCGSGRYSDLLASAGYTGDYVGVDIGDNIPHQSTYAEAFKRSFHNIDAHEFSSDVPFDLIISMSALEHIDRDDQLIGHLDQFLSDKGAQLHVVPGAWGLPLYLWHGYRQYNLHSLESRFGTNGTRIYALGGFASFLLHFLFITLAEIIFRLPMRRWFRRLYQTLHRLCLRFDRYTPSAPSGYIVYRPSLMVVKGSDASTLNPGGTQ